MVFLLHFCSFDSNLEIAYSWLFFSYPVQKMLFSYSWLLFSYPGTFNRCYELSNFDFSQEWIPSWKPCAILINQVNISISNLNQICMFWIKFGCFESNLNQNQNLWEGDEDMIYLIIQYFVVSILGLNSVFWIKFGCLIQRPISFCLKMIHFWEIWFKH